jgi:hypothetical protein
MPGRGADIPRQRIACLALLAAVVAAAPSHAEVSEVDPHAAGESASLIVFDFQSEDGKRAWIARDPVPIPRFLTNLLKEGMSACLFVAFVVQADGAVSGARLLKWETNVGGKRRGQQAIRVFAGAVSSMLERLSFDPGPDNPGREPGFTGFPVAFSAPDSKMSTRECEIADLAAYLSGNIEPARPDLPGEPGTTIEPEKTGD